jgi:hypothetical protein
MYGKKFFEMFFIWSRGFTLGERFVFNLFLCITGVDKTAFDKRVGR